MARTHRDYSFARTPRWIAGHLIAVIGIGVFVNLGLWQLRRLDERQARNATITSRLAAPASPLTELVGSGVDPETLEYRRVTVTGEYVPDEEVILRARTRRSVSGNEVLTPLRTDAAAAVIVDRGWVPLDVVGPPVVGAETPSGPVTVTGILRLSEPPGGLGPRDPAEGTLEKVSRVDVARLDLQTAAALVPLWIQLESQVPAQASEYPIPVDLPELGEGPHLTYAGQWFIFAVIVLVGYPALLRRTAPRL